MPNSFATRSGWLSLALIAILSGCRGGSSGNPNTPLTPDSHTAFAIKSGPHAQDCNVCHGAFATFAQFSCLDCHGHEQALTDQLHASVAGYAYDSTACYGCHTTGAGQGFDHLGLIAPCATCHDVGAAFAALPVANFTHQPIGAADCGGCHNTTDWTDASGAPSGLVRDPVQDLPLAALIPTYVGTSIATLTGQNENLPMPMSHTSGQVVAAAFSACSNCHADASTGVFYPGTLHSSLANLSLAEPTSCSDCHAMSMPTGFVGPTATSPSRTPASGEMKHDAVAWNASGPTPTKLVSSECSACHLSPSQAVDATWAMAKSGTSPARYHASLIAASQTQPGSCLDCHANTRPVTLLTSANSSLTGSLQFDHSDSRATGDCATCHTNGLVASWTAAWSGGRFHLAGSANPSTCLPCHAGERPTSTSGWVSTTFANSPFDYGTNTSSITHGDGQDCAVCHSGPGTGAWGGTQNWVGGSFTHAASTVAGSTCIACHTSQRPATIVSGFDHSLNGTGDCFGCHQATVVSGHYVNYTGDWQGGQSYPGDNLVGSPNQFITTTELTLNRSGPANLVTSTSSILATLYNEMLHVSTAIPVQVRPGPSASPDYASCWHCHTNTGGTVTSFADGEFHPALTAYSATPGGAVTPLAQPTTQCTNCHTQMRPVGIVEKAASPLRPMDHNALFQSAAVIGGVSVTSVTQVECAVCHHSPGNTWTDGVFHANIGSAVPQDCNVCHYPLMATAASSDVTSGALYVMKHRSTQLTFQNCQSCHTTALSKSTSTPASTLWQTGAFHAHVSPQPTACNECHTVSVPASLTQSSVVYSLPAGGTASNGGQWMNHKSAQVSGTDCVVCHAADAKTSGSAWSKSDSFHAKVLAPTTCQECHGLTNGGGAVPGTNNNLPSGITSSTTVSAAGSDPASGIPAGTLDQISHSDVNVTAHDCRFCHTQMGTSTTAGIQGKEWAKALFHVNFGSASPLVANGTTGRCSNCHINLKAGPSITAFNHASLTSTSGTQDCSACHSWPGTGTASAPNWLGAAGVPQYLNVGGFTIPQPPAANTTTTQLGIANLPHPTVGAGVACTTCHATAAGGKGAFGYDHANANINSNCAACHEAGSNLVGTLWNGATTQAAGAGDTRPFTLTSVRATKGGNSLTVTYPKHFYPVDCHQCHIVPAGNGFVTTGSGYTSAWTFPHTQNKMTNPGTCVMCHTNGIPN